MHAKELSEYIHVNFLQEYGFCSDRIERNMHVNYNQLYSNLTS